MAGRLKDKVAIVVGAGSIGPGYGNGKCTAITFAREGARVFCVDRKRAAAEETVGLISQESSKYGGEAVAFEADASKNDSVKAMVDACMAKWGHIDVLDNNVGIGSTGGPVELSEDEWDRVFDVNVKSFFLTAKHVLPVMEKQGNGAIVNVSSIASIRSPKGISYIAYNASKGAVNSLTLAIASQYAAKGIRCNAILPGLMHTPMIDFLAEQYAKGEGDHNQAYDKMIAIRDRARRRARWGPDGTPPMPPCSWRRTKRPMSTATCWWSMAALPSALNYSAYVRQCPVYIKETITLSGYRPCLSTTVRLRS